MDYTRHCYRTVIKPWQDQDTLVPIRWYRPGPDAQLIGGWVAFRSLVSWDRQGDIPDVGEQQKSPQTTYDKGDDTLHLEGDHRCGSDYVWQHGARTDIDPVFTTDAQGNAPCCIGIEEIMCCTHGIIQVPAGNLNLAMSGNTFFDGVTAITLGRVPATGDPGWRARWEGLVLLPASRVVTAVVLIYTLEEDDTCHMLVQVEEIVSIFPVVDWRTMSRTFDLDCEFTIGDLFPATGEITTPPWSPSFGATTATRQFPFPGSFTYEDIGWVITY